MPLIRAMTTTSPFDGVTQGFWVIPSWGDGSWVGGSQAEWGLGQGLSASQIRAQILDIYAPLLSEVVDDKWFSSPLPQWYTRRGNTVYAQLVNIEVEVISNNPLVLSFTCSEGASGERKVVG